MRPCLQFCTGIGLPSYAAVNDNSTVLELVSNEEDRQGAIISLMPPGTDLATGSSRTGMPPANSIVSGPILASGNLRVHLSQGDEARLHRALSLPSAAELPSDGDSGPSTSEAAGPARAGTSSAASVRGTSPPPSAVRDASPSLSEASAGCASAAADPNADRIKSLVKRFLKAPPAQPAAAQPATAQPAPSAPSSKSQIDVSVAVASPDSGKKQLRRPAADDAAKAGLKHTQPAVASTTGGQDVTRRAAVSPEGSKELSLDAVLAKYELPDEVATAVADAVAAKQLPSKPSSLDNLLARLLLPGAGLKPELVHAGGCA